MKLLFCKKCQDAFKLQIFEARTCVCGKVSGKYLDELNAIYSGAPAIPLVLANSSLAGALFCRPEEGDGFPFDAFVVPKVCDTFRKVEKIS